MSVKDHYSPFFFFFFFCLFVCLFFLFVVVFFLLLFFLLFFCFVFCCCFFSFFVLFVCLLLCLLDLVLHCDYLVGKEGMVVLLFFGLRHLCYISWFVSCPLGVIGRPLPGHLLSCCKVFEYTGQIRQWFKPMIMLPLTSLCYFFLWQM